MNKESDNCSKSLPHSGGIKHALDAILARCMARSPKWRIGSLWRGSSVLALLPELLARWLSMLIGFEDLAGRGRRHGFLGSVALR